MTEAFVWDYGNDKKQKVTEWPETKKILKDIQDEIDKDNRRLVYSHKVGYTVA